tara:strand:+ start:1640 stop:1813 length:174 start_codon:yes stop_codon:yes gene_type:complete
MRKLIPFLLFSSASLYSLIDALPVTANGCGLHNEKLESVCKEGDKKCKSANAEDINI